jgi:hypothetical protein
MHANTIVTGLPSDIGAVGEFGQLTRDDLATGKDRHERMPTPA